MIRFRIRSKVSEMRERQSDYYDHTTTLFKNLKILPLNLLLRNSKLLFMHSYVYNYCPSSFHNTWNLNDDRHLDHNLRNANEFTIPNPRIDLFKKSPLYSLPKLWNELDAIKHHQNRTTFKISLREQLFAELNEIPD